MKDFKDCNWCQRSCGLFLGTKLNSIKFSPQAFNSILSMKPFIQKISYFYTYIFYSFKREGGAENKLERMRAQENRKEGEKKRKRATKNNTVNILTTKDRKKGELFTQNEGERKEEMSSF